VTAAPTAVALVTLVREAQRRPDWDAMGVVEQLHGLVDELTPDEAREAAVYLATTLASVVDMAETLSALEADDFLSTLGLQAALESL
jgi:hypothetical protein